MQQLIPFLFRKLLHRDDFSCFLVLETPTVNLDEVFHFVLLLILQKMPARAHCHFVFKPSGVELHRAVNTFAATRFRLHALSDSPAETRWIDSTATILFPSHFTAF